MNALLRGDRCGPSSPARRQPFPGQTADERLTGGGRGVDAYGWVAAVGLAALLLVGVVAGDLLHGLADDVRAGEGVAGMDRPVLDLVLAHREVG